MNIREIESTVHDIGFTFEKYRDFSGITDRYRYNHNVLINGPYRLVATNKNRTLWKVMLESNGKLTTLFEKQKLTDAIKLCTQERAGAVQ